MTPLNLLKANTSIIEQNVFKAYELYQNKCLDLIIALNNNNIAQIKNKIEIEKISNQKEAITTLNMISAIKQST